MFLYIILSFIPIIHNIEPQSTDTYEFSLRHNQEYDIIVSGNQKTDLDCYLYDSIGNLIDEDEDFLTDCHLSGKSKLNEKFVLKIVNTGTHTNHYILNIER
jgi:hypothetical protein